MRVAYFVQSHASAGQVLRLLATLRRGSPDAILIEGRDPTAEPLDAHAVAALDVLSCRPARRPRRGYWSLFEPYPEAVERLDRAGLPYDWLVYLSGQDYPVQPLAASEARLAGGYAFARKLDATVDAGILDWLDARMTE